MIRIIFASVVMIIAISSVVLAAIAIVVNWFAGHPWLGG